MLIKVALVVRARRNNGNADDTDDADLHGFFRCYRPFVLIPSRPRPLLRVPANSNSVVILK